MFCVLCVWTTSLYSLFACFAIMECKNPLTGQFDVDCCKRDVKLAAAAIDQNYGKTFFGHCCWWCATHTYYTQLVLLASCCLVFFSCYFPHEILPFHDNIYTTNILPLAWNTYIILWYIDVNVLCQTADVWSQVFVVVYFGSVAQFLSRILDWSKPKELYCLRNRTKTLVHFTWNSLFALLHFSSSCLSNSVSSHEIAYVIIHSNWLYKWKKKRTLKWKIHASIESCSRSAMKPPALSCLLALSHVSYHQYDGYTFDFLNTTEACNPPSSAALYSNTLTPAQARKHFW